jgi:hypothetical protein
MLAYMYSSNSTTFSLESLQHSKHKLWDHAKQTNVFDTVRTEWKKKASNV